VDTPEAGTEDAADMLTGEAGKGGVDGLGAQPAAAAAARLAADTDAQWTAASNAPGPCSVSKAPVRDRFRWWLCFGLTAEMQTCSALGLLWN
jgi:hypothetical protein